VSFEFVRADVLRNVQRRIIERYGGVAGIRHDNSLESAIGRPRNLVDFGDETSVAVLGAALAWALLRNHPFSDGNKRAAFAGLVMFLDLNGHQLTCTEVEETAMILRAAATEISESVWIAWVERNVAPLVLQT